MRITNCGPGVHKREIVGIERLQSLPANWYAYTNLELALSPGKSREIDVIVIAEDRIFLIDLKDWHGLIESRNGRWFQNGLDRGPSPIAKMLQNRKDIWILLDGYVRKHAKAQGLSTPTICGLVVMTAVADTRGIAATEVRSVVSIDDFVNAVETPRARVNAFGPVSRTFVHNPLTAPDWKHHLSRFFNVQTGPFRPGRRNYGGFFATSDTAVFEGPAKIYAEYDVVGEKASETFGTLRVWDFTKADTRFQNQESRAEIVGRERDVIAYLRDRDDECERAILPVTAEDPDRGVSHWEVYDRRRRMNRLRDFVPAETAELSRDGKIELARQILSKVNALHLVDAAHLDLGMHSIWLRLPSTVRLSHLMAASYPQVQSLGETRYQFLSCAKVPEDVLRVPTNAKRKDVFLLGVALHHLLFDRPPQSEDEQMPPEWSPMVDDTGEHEDLHPWFKKALALDPAERFADAGTALDAFNETVAAHPSAKEIIEGLEQFRASIRSQMQLFGTLSPTKTVRDDMYRSIWQSQQDGQPVFVKMWKRSSWGDQTREGPRLLDFLTRARELQRSPSPGCPTVRDAIWLGDAIVLVQDWIEAPNLADLVHAEPDVWAQTQTVLEFLKTLTERIIALHDLGVAHGDLKPQNILVADGKERRPVIVDVIDFSATGDGEIRSTAYAPAGGGRRERDRYAVTKIAEELLGACGLEPRRAAMLEKAIAECRTNTPANGTLLPFLETINLVLAPAPAHDRLLVRISIRHAGTGRVLADEGLFYLRRAPDRESLFIRGACEEIEICFNDKGQAFRGRRRPVDQKSISMTSKYDFMSVACDIEIAESDIDDFSELKFITEDPAFIAKWHRSASTSIQHVEVEDEPSVGDSFGDGAQDALIEAISKEPLAVECPDVARLWRRLIDAESELTTEGQATNESSYRREISRHVVPFELDCGTFDFSRDDRVLVERLERKGNWRRIGHLDIAHSKSDFLVIDATRFFISYSGSIVDDNQRLRFTSHYEQTSLDRRRNAISRILSRQSRIPDLIDVFDPNGGKVPHCAGVAVDSATLTTAYELNDAQAESLSALLDLRPVGLLQGPPGTGKTIFIAALVHYALTQGLAQNVLLASQSHEAVNNAAESVLKLFAKNKEQPSILRVGHEGDVSDRLLPFHTARVEQSYKDRFQASMKERLRVGGRALGIDDALIEDIAFIEMAIRPVAEKLADLETSDPPDDRKITSLRTTIHGQLDVVGLTGDVIDNVSGKDIVDAVTQMVSERSPKRERMSPDKIARLRALARLARDFIGSVSTAQRSFETFLAGTRQIVAGTCVGLGRSSLGLTATPFDLVVVDEAARCTASELAVPIQAARWIVLVGDHAQLEPQHKREIVVEVAAEVKTTQREVLRSDFERMFETPYGAAAGRRLTKQYRMISPVGRLVSSSFYKGALEHGRTELEINEAALPRDLDKALLWVETDSFGNQASQKPETNGTSLTNPVEAELILALLKQWEDCDPFREWLETQTAHAHPIGVICTYAAQRDLLRRKLQMTNLSVHFRSSIKIDTVDSYQGKENPIVVLSLVRNNADGPQESGVAVVRDGFLARPNRINVAMSRAKDRLVIIGAKGRWPRGGPMARVVESFDREAARDNARIIEGPRLLNPDMASDPADQNARPSHVAKRA